MKKILIMAVLLTVSSAAFPQKGTYHSNKRVMVTGDLIGGDCTVEETVKTKTDIVITDTCIQVITTSMVINFKIHVAKRLNLYRTAYSLKDKIGDKWIMGILKDENDPLHPYIILLSHLNKKGEETYGALFDVKEYER